MQKDNPEKIPLPVLDVFSISWFDKLLIRINRLPVPFWVPYILFGFLLAAIGILIQLFDQSRSSLGFAPIELLLFFQIVYMLILMTYLYRQSKKALVDFRPVLKISGDQTTLFETSLISMPARSFNRLSWIFLLVFSVMGVFIFTNISDPSTDISAMLSQFTFTLSPFGIYGFSAFTLLWYVNTIFIYSTIHQLRVINHAYTQLAEINLFRQTELYAFSRVLAARAIGIVLTSPIWLLLDTGIVTLIINIVFSTLALVIFFVPLIGVHGLLAKQKDVLLGRSMQKKEVIIQQLLKELDQGKTKEVVNRREELSSLTLALGEIEKVSTWPWQTRTLQQIGGAITLPTVLWVIQFFLAKMLEG